MKKRTYTMVIGLLLIVSSCAGRYVGMPSAVVLNYQTDPTYGNVYSLACEYGAAINNAVANDTAYPGLYADYGVTLALMGHPAEASKMLNAEMARFPESRPMVERLKWHLLPEWVSDTVVPRGDTANLVLLKGWAYDSVAALVRLPRVASVIDSTDSALVQMQTPVDSIPQPIKLTANQKRELLAQEQSKLERERKAHEDSIRAAKQAKIDARKQAEYDKKKAKKEREKARKQADKEKKRIAKEKKKQREAAKRQRQESRKEQGNEE